MIIWLTYWTNEIHLSFGMVVLVFFIKINLNESERIQPLVLCNYFIIKNQISHAQKTFRAI